MDVMRPDLDWINGFCYRSNPGNYTNNRNTFEETLSYEQEESCPIERFEDEDLSEEAIEELENGRYKLAFHVAKTYFPYIIGSKGATKKRLEAETRTKINIPKPGQDGDIVVTGSEKKSVCSAKTRILMMVMSSRKRQPFTHFVSIPFSTPTFKQRYLTFKEEVLKTCTSRGVEESIFQNPDKLHLTVCTLVLGDDVERNHAASTLEKCKEDVIIPLLTNRPLKIEMSGVEYMNDDPTEIDVLYGKVTCPENPEVLQNACDGIVDYFVKQGLVDREFPRVKLHVTLMNTLFRSQETYDKKKTRETFDGSQIISAFRDFFFGSDVISTIELSVRFSTSKTGYYQSTSAIDLL